MASIQLFKRIKVPTITLTLGKPYTECPLHFEKAKTGGTMQISQEAKDKIDKIEGSMVTEKQLDERCNTIRAEVALDVNNAVSASEGKIIDAINKKNEVRSMAKEIAKAMREQREEERHNRYLDRGKKIDP